MSSIPEFTLQNGNTIPLLGFGTAEYPFGSSSETMKETFLHAIKLGYRHFDSAAIYQSEQLLGEAMHDALNLGLIKSRDELFITSKLWCSNGHHDRVVPAIQKTLSNLKLEYVDLYLIHIPVSLKTGEIGLSFKKEDILPMDIKSVWEAMENCQKLGLAKSIGVSNFTRKKLETLLSTAKIHPAANQVITLLVQVFPFSNKQKLFFQVVGSSHGPCSAADLFVFAKVEMNPYWQQEQLREFCEEKGIHITAYSPLGGKGTIWGTNWIMECEVLKEIAKAKGRTIAQISLRWVYEQGVSVVVKSFNKERMKENLDIFDWNLSPDELQKITGIPQRKGFIASEFISDEGPYKTLSELWDGEI